MLNGPWLLIVVSALLALAALALAARLFAEQEDEQAFAAGVLFLMGCYLSVHTLGWCNVLTRRNLALTTVALSLTTLAACLVGVSERRRFVRAALLLPPRALLRALRVTWRAQSFTFFGLVGALGVIAWTSFLTYLAPSNSWDGMWYHDSIVGFAIQNRGFAIERSLPVYHALINGYAKGSEYFSIFPVLLWDRRLIELHPSVFGLVALPGLTALFRRLGLRAHHAVGLASTFVLLPAFCLQMRSTYIDATVVTIYLFAVYFATVPRLRVRDAVMATVATGMLCNAKSSGLPIAAVVFGLLSLRIALAFVRKAPLRTAVGLVLALATVTAVGGPIYIRNYTTYKNPFYPLPLHSERLNIHWEGPLSVTILHDWQRFIPHLISPPVPNAEFPDTHTNGYGNGVPFLVFPVALAGVLWLARTWLRAARERRVGPALAQVTTLTLLTLALAPITPSVTWARFALPMLLGVFCLYAWCIAHERVGNFSEGSLASLVFTSFLTLLWSDPAWTVTPARAWELWKQTPEERSGADILFAPVAEVGLARAAEIKRGDLVLAEYAVDFMSLLWNERYTNEVRMFDADDLPKAKVLFQREKPKWVAARPLSPVGRALSQDPLNWQPIGDVRGGVTAYRRLTPYRRPTPYP